MIRPRIGRIASVALAGLLATGPVVLASSEGAVTMTVRVNPLTVVLDLSATTVAVGKTIQARAVVTNRGSTVVRDVVVELRLDREGLAIGRGAVREIGQIKAGRSASVAWSICAASPGTYVLLAQATANGATVESAARIVSVTGGGRRTC